MKQGTYETGDGFLFHDKVNGIGNTHCMENTLSIPYVAFEEETPPAPLKTPQDPLKTPPAPLFRGESSQAYRSSERKKWHKVWKLRKLFLILSANNNNR